MSYHDTKRGFFEVMGPLRGGYHDSHDMHQILDQLGVLTARNTLHEGRMNRDFTQICEFVSHAAAMMDMRVEDPTGSGLYDTGSSVNKISLG